MAKKRTDIILDILKSEGYVTVKYLTEKLHYSTATINRDLNDLQNRKLIKRHYGGAELIESRATPLVFRYHKMRPVKNVIAKKAADFINNGDTIFIDASTTAQCIGQYITDKKDLTVITNNMMLASFLSENNIKCICLGGEIVEIPYMLDSADTAEFASHYIADKMFFSTGGISSDGAIYGGNAYYYLHLTMQKNSDKVFYLADHQKIDVKIKKILFDLSKVDYIISDYTFNDSVKEKYKDTNFIEVPTPKTQK